MSTRDYFTLHLAVVTGGKSGVLIKPTAFMEKIRAACKDARNHCIFSLLHVIESGFWGRLDWKGSW